MFLQICNVVTGTSKLQMQSVWNLQPIEYDLIMLCQTGRSLNFGLCRHLDAANHNAFPLGWHFWDHQIKRLCNHNNPQFHWVVVSMACVNECIINIIIESFWGLKVIWTRILSSHWYLGSSYYGKILTFKVGIYIYIYLRAIESRQLFNSAIENIESHDLIPSR